MIGDEEKLEYSRPQDYYDDFEDEFSDDENNSDAPRSGKNGIVLPSHLLHILESSDLEDSDEESESIPFLKEQLFRSIINQEKLLEKETEAVKKRVRFQIDDDRQSRERSVKQVDLPKRSLVDLEKSVNKSLVSGTSNKIFSNVSNSSVSTPVTGKTINPGNCPVSTIKNDLANETTNNVEIINRALHTVNIDDSSDYMAQEILRMFNIAIFINPRPVSHFGFVPVNDSSTKSIFVFNPSDKKIHIRPELYSETFFLNSGSTILMPNQEKEFQVQFMPKNKRHFSGKIYFHVGETKFSHKLIGFGGAAECILMNPKLKLLQNTQYCLRPKDPTSFDLTVDNVGDRASFMHIVAVNRRGEIIDEVKFSHQRFCLNHGHDRVEKTVKITVPQSVLTSIEERPNIVSQSSAGYSTKNPDEKYLFDLKIYWGEERLRQRAKKYILLEKMSHPKIGDIYCTRDVYTANNDKEVQLLENMDLTIQDVEMLKAQTRMFTVKIYDGRVNTSGSTSRQQFRN